MSRVFHDYINQLFQRRMAEAEHNSAELSNGAPAVDEDDRKLFVGGLPQDATQV